METYQVAPDRPTHGYDGPLKISHGGLFTNMGKQFLDVAAQYDKTRSTTDDPSDMIGINAYGVSTMIYKPFSNSTPSRDGKSMCGSAIQPAVVIYLPFSRYIDKEKGRRSDVPHNYIYNRQLDNLEILTGYHVKRVIFECVSKSVSVFEG